MSEGKCVSGLLLHLIREIHRITDIHGRRGGGGRKSDSSGNKAPALLAGHLVFESSKLMVILGLYLTSFP